LPIYDYICKDCQERFDLFIGVAGKDEKHICKKCGSKNIEKIFASFGVGPSSDKDRDDYCPTGTCPLS